LKRPALRRAKQRADALRADLRRRRARHRFAAALTALREIAPADPDPELLEELRAGWGDPDSAPAGLLAAAISHFRAASGEGVECGSGLSTVVLGVYAEALGRRWWALEHHPEWRARVADELARHGLRAARVLEAPLVDHGGHRWYAVPDELPERIELVLCDGPPADRPGLELARYGLLPVLGDRFGERVTVLLDDAGRPGEQSVLALWESAGLRWSSCSAERQFAIVTRD